MRRLLTLLIFLFTASIACGQVTLLGKVIDSANNLPVAHASVYINNSSIGTTTNNNGEFSLSITIKGSLTVVVSHLSYKIKTIPINTGSVSAKLLIRLNANSSELREVIINGSGLSGWRKWRSLFTRYFIGEMKFSKDCRILNPKALLFHYDRANSILTVKTNEPLLIENKALGFLYHIDLDNFTYSFRNQLVNSNFSTFFENIKPGSQAQQEKFSANRVIAFNGSKMHFFRALYNGNSNDQGFFVRIVSLKENREKVRITRLMSDALAEAYRENTNVNNVTLLLIANGDVDTVSYFQRVLAQPDYRTDHLLPLSLNKILTPDSIHQTAKLHVIDTLLVQYAVPVKKAKVIKPGVLVLSSGDLNFSQLGGQSDSSGMEDSVMLTIPAGDITIYPNGNYDGNNLLIDGYMADGRIGYLLPWDYVNPD